MGIVIGGGGGLTASVEDEIKLDTTYSVVNDTTAGLPSPLVFDPSVLPTGFGRYEIELIIYADNDNQEEPGLVLSICHATSFSSNFCENGYILAQRIKNFNLTGVSFIGSSMNNLLVFDNGVGVAVTKEQGVFTVKMEADFLSASDKFTISLSQKTSSALPVYLRAGSVIRYKKID